MNKKKIILLVIIVITIIAAVLIVRSRNENDHDRLVLSGNMEVTEVNLGFKIPGRVVRLMTDEGRTVAAGEKIALLDSSEYESQVAQNRAAMANAEAALDKAKKDLERADILFRSGAISSQQMDAARTTHDLAQAQQQQSSAALRASEARLRDTILVSPIAGVVLRKNVELGETVAAGTPVCTIGDMADPWVKVYVKEDRLGWVKLNQKAEVTVDSYPGKAYIGTVTFISPEAEFTPKNVQTREERVKLVFGVKVSVKNENDELKPGMPADVKIVVKP